MGTIHQLCLRLLSVRRRIARKHGRTAGREENALPVCPPLPACLSPPAASHSAAAASTPVARAWPSPPPTPSPPPSPPLSADAMAGGPHKWPPCPHRVVLPAGREAAGAGPGPGAEGEAPGSAGAGTGGGAGVSGAVGTTWARVLPAPAVPRAEGASNHLAPGLKRGEEVKG